MAKLSERVQQQQETRRTRRPLPPSHPRGSTAEPGVDAQPDQPDEVHEGEVIDLTSAPSSVRNAPTVPAPVADNEGTASPAHSQAAAAPAASAAAGEGTTVRRETKARWQEPEVAVPLEPRQVWLDQQNDLWLSECEYANVRRGGRKVISRSSVVRLALDRLREAMTPEQITELLAGREPITTGRGRPRR